VAVPADLKNSRRSILMGSMGSIFSLLMIGEMTLAHP